MKLISMVDFVLEQKRPIASADLPEADYYYQEYCVLQNICNYANFIKQPLELWMFVPCDEDGNALEKPEMIYNVGVFGVYNGLFQNKNEYIKQYQQAKERCLFEGFIKYMDSEFVIYVVDKNNSYFGFWKQNGDCTYCSVVHQTIEDLVKYNLQLTSTTLK